MSTLSAASPSHTFVQGTSADRSCPGMEKNSPKMTCATTIGWCVEPCCASNHSSAEKILRPCLTCKPPQYYGLSEATRVKLEIDTWPSPAAEHGRVAQLLLTARQWLPC